MSRVFTRFFLKFLHENGPNFSHFLTSDRGCLRCFSLGRLGGGRCGYLGEVVTLVKLFDSTEELEGWNP